MLALQKELLAAIHVRQLYALVLAKVDDENAGQCGYPFVKRLRWFPTARNI